MNETKQQFLVIQTAFIGDAVLATGLLEKLHAFFPDAAIDYMVRKGNERLFSGHPFLRETLVWDKKSGKLKNWWKMLRLIRSRHYDKVINVQRFAATGLMTAFSGARQTIGFDKNPLSFLFTSKIPHRIQQGPGAIHEINRNNELVAAFTDSQAFRPRLYPRVADREAIRKFQGAAYVCIAPASVWFTKQYPAEKWRELIRQLPQNWAIFLLGAPGDRDFAESLTEDGKEKNIVNLCGQLDFLQSAALMQGALMNYVNDSAPLHFASAVNAPVTAIYCSTLPSFGFGPLSDNSHIVECPEALPCRPCGLHGKKACPLGHFNCARLIGASQLLECLPGAPEN